MEQRKRYGGKFTRAVITNLVTNYGSGIHKIIGLIEADAGLADELTAGRHTLVAEIIYSARHEMPVIWMIYFSANRSWYSG